jgi:hypothetical protein
MNKYYSFFFILCCFTLSAKETAPCWLNEPVGKNQTGFIGVANALSIKKNGSLIASRKRALEKAIKYYELALNSNEIEDLTEDFISLSDNLQLYFSPSYSDDQLMYSYALVIKNAEVDTEQNLNQLTKQCEISRCNFSQCEPSWLCENNNNSLNSVSQMTANPRHQLKKTYDNAQQLIRYLDKSYVDDKNYRIQSTGEHQNWQSNTRSTKVDELGDNTPLLHTNSCQAENYLFTRYSFISDSEKSTKPFSLWLKESNIGERNGAVGIFKGIMADGRFSSALKFAIKDGLIELAKSKEIDITNELKVTFNNGWYSLSKTIETTSTTIRAKLMDLKITHENGQLTIYAWLLEN